MSATLEEYLVSDGCGEYVAYFNSCGTVMYFTRDRGEARRTTDSREAARVAEVARSVYGRKGMDWRMVL